MKYENMIEGIFLERPNRFIAIVLINGKEETVHVKNTGRCRELLIKGVTVYLRHETNPARKTKYSLISVVKNNMLINMDSQIPNYVVYEALQENKIHGINAEAIKKEVQYDNSRFDIYFKSSGKESFMEVKGVTLEENGFAVFPDAPTQRGAKHLKELIKAKKEGYGAYIFFLIQMDKINAFGPNYERDTIFSEALEEAYKKGVQILCYNSKVSTDSISIGESIQLVFK